MKKNRIPRDRVALRRLLDEMLQMGESTKVIARRYRIPEATLAQAWQREGWNLTLERQHYNHRRRGTTARARLRAMLPVREDA